jgi:hypothetical protein
MGNYDYKYDWQKTAYEKARDYGIEYLDKGLTELLKNVPFGDSIKNIVKDQLLSVFGIEGEKTITTNELSDKLDKLDEKMEQAFDKQTKELIAAMESAFTTGTYKADLKQLADSYDIVSIIQGNSYNHKLTEEEKMVKLAMIVGNSDDWREGSFMMEYISVANDMLGNNYLSNKDIFTALYNSQKGNYMMSGEVIDAIEPYIQKMIFDYLRYTIIALASLEAQEAIISDDFDVSKITNKQIKAQYDKFTNDDSTIENAKILIAKNVFGSDAFVKNGITIPKRTKLNTVEGSYDNILAHYESFKKMNRLVHIPTGKVLNPNLQQESGYKLIGNDAKETEQFGLDEKESTSADNFEKKISGTESNSYNHNCFDKNQMETMFAYVSAQIASGKYTSVVDYLQKMGFNVDPTWSSGENTQDNNADGWYFVTGGGYREYNYEWELFRTNYDVEIDVVNLNSGKIEKRRWRKVTNMTGDEVLYDDEVSCYGMYLMFHEASDMTSQQIDAKNKNLKQLTQMMFDADFYYEKYPDLQIALGHDTIKLYEHFRNQGIKEGRQFSKYFDLQYYLNNNPDVKAAFGGDYAKTLNHFLEYGVYEGRSPSPLYDSKSYVKAYPDLTPYERFYNFLVKNNTINAVSNFIKNGG